MNWLIYFQLVYSFFILTLTLFSLAALCTESERTIRRGRVKPAKFGPRLRKVHHRFKRDTDPDASSMSADLGKSSLSNLDKSIFSKQYLPQAKNRLSPQRKESNIPYETGEFGQLKLNSNFRKEESSEDSLFSTWFSYFLAFTDPKKNRYKICS